MQTSHFNNFFYTIHPYDSHAKLAQRWPLKHFDKCKQLIFQIKNIIATALVTCIHSNIQKNDKTLLLKYVLLHLNIWIVYLFICCTNNTFQKQQKIHTCTKPIILVLYFKITHATNQTENCKYAIIMFYKYMLHRATVIYNTKEQCCIT